MKKLIYVFSLLVMLGSTGLAFADGPVNAGPRVTASVAFPGVRLVFGRPGAYCWYQGRSYSRAAWDRYRYIHRDRDRDRDRF